MTVPYDWAWHLDHIMRFAFDWIFQTLLYPGEFKGVERMFRVIASRVIGTVAAVLVLRYLFPTTSARTVAWHWIVLLSFVYLSVLTYRIQRRASSTS